VGGRGDASSLLVVAFADGVAAKRRVHRGASTDGGGGSKCLFYSTKSCHEGIRTWGGARGRGGVNCGRRSKFVDDVVN
jgi:hypothetical protein